MNTTENISLSGYAFTIKTDAYEALSAYIDAIHRKFAADPCAEEICGDIEERIGELFLEKCPGGKVVDLEAVEYAKGRIGDPADFDGENADTKTESRQEKTGCRLKGRKIYRDTDERVVSGVCSGLGYYLNVNKVFIRLGFIAIAAFGIIARVEWMVATPFLLYLCLMVCVPAAKTVEQRCEMKNQPVSLESFGSRDFRIKEEISELSSSPAAKAIMRAVGLCIGLVLLFIGIGGMFSCIFIRPLTDVISTRMLEDSMHFTYDHVDHSLMQTCITLFTDRYMIIGATAVIGLLSIWLIYNGVMMTFDLKSPSWKPGLVIFVLWIISILAVVAWGLILVADLLPMYIGV